jgi:dUTP pyrophosphatase
MNIQIQKLSEGAKIPSFAHNDDAAMDFFASEMVTIDQGKRAQVRTGIAVAIPEGFAGLIWDKSGLSHKAGLKVIGGVIDAGYRGEILIGIMNLSEDSYTFKVGDKIAQMLIQKIEHPEIVEVAMLGETTRGANGFGSTGV